MKVVALVPAAGLGVRMAGGRPAKVAAPPKQLLELDGVPLLFWTLRRLAASPRLEKIVVALRPGDRETVAKRLAGEDYAARVALVPGGETRQESVALALRAVPAGTEFVLVHDAVRPFVEPALFDRVLAAAAETGAAILGLPASDTIKQVEAFRPDPAEPTGGLHAARITATLPRERLVLAQTPQAFRYSLLKEAIEAAGKDGFQASDEAGLVERLGHTVAVVMGSERNIKITTPADLDLARFLLGRERK